MKKRVAGLITAAALTGFSAQSFAGSTAGCGWGTMIFNGQSGLFPHVLAATTNGILGNQTFGMTSGTLGCDVSEPIESMALYIDKNFDKVARDISRGEGENLDALAAILGVEAEDRPHFAKLLRTNFITIFPNSEVTSDSASDSISHLMQADGVLAKYVS